MRAKLNRTERRRIPRSDVNLRVLEGETVVVSLTGDLSQHAFGKDAVVVLDISRKARTERVEIGPATALIELPHAAINFDTPHGLVYDLKVVSPSTGRLLGVALNLAPASTGLDEATSLLTIRPVSNLGQRLWRLELTDGAVLEVNDSIPDVHEYVRRLDFQALVYPQVLAEIATELITNGDVEGPLGEWTLLLGELGFPNREWPQTAHGDTTPDVDDVHEYVRELVKAFCHKHAMLSRVAGAAQ